MLELKELPIPEHFRDDMAGSIWPVEYDEIAKRARQWANKWDITPASRDKVRIGLLGIDLQIAFCVPRTKLFIAGRSGYGAVVDNLRLSRLIYRLLPFISQIILTRDTHCRAQISHSCFWLDQEGRHPEAGTIICPEDIQIRRWRVNPCIAESLLSIYPHLKGEIPEFSYDYLQDFVLHYAKELRRKDKYPLMIFPYHAVETGIGHALAPIIEEAVCFHSHARETDAQLIPKSSHPLVESFSPIRAQVSRDQFGKIIVPNDLDLANDLLDFDLLLIAGQAKSHCVALTVNDLLEEIKRIDPGLARKIYVLTDCMSDVVTPQVDFTDMSEEIFRGFAEAGINLVESTRPFESWPGVREIIGQ